jgi:hypothetical protein
MADDDRIISLFANRFQIQFHTNDKHEKDQTDLAKKLSVPNEAGGNKK